MTTHQYRVFTATLCAAIYGISGYSNIFRYVMFSPSVSSIGDFFNAKGMTEKINRRHRRRLMRLMGAIRHDPQRYQWVIDDTLVKHHGKTIWGAYNWHDHVTNGYVFGHKILVLGIEDKKRRLLIPVAWEILHRDLSREADVGEKDAVHEKGWAVALRLLDSMIAFGFPKFTVSADCWFACEELFDALEQREMRFVLEVRSNRKVARHGRSAPNISVADFFADRDRHIVQHNGKVKFAAEATLVLNKTKRLLKVVAVANKRDLGDAAFGYYVTNQLNWNASRVWGTSRDRWGIEVQFRDLKQIFTFGEAAVRSQQAVETAISIAAIALTVIRLEQIAQADANKNQHVQPKTAGSIVRDFQLESLQRCIKKLVAPHEQQFRLRFQSRMNRENLNGKPAEGRRRRRTLAGHGLNAKTG